MYFCETRLVRKVIFTVPTIPAARLSEATIDAKRVKFLSVIAVYENKRFVIITKKAPINRDLYNPYFLIRMPPTKTPTMVEISATTFTI